MSQQHTVKAYDIELKELHTALARMGGLAEAQIANAIEAAVNRDPELAARTIRDDDVIDELEHQIDDAVVRLLALRQPMGRDLRAIVSALKISSDLERIADCATNIAKRAIRLKDAPPVKPLYAIPRMGRYAQQMTKDVLDAYIEGDTEKAIQVWYRDEELDEAYTALFRELLTYMMEDPRNITPCTHLLFIAKNIERIGDHATNVAETIHFLVEGGPFRDTIPRDDPSEAGDTTTGPETP